MADNDKPQTASILTDEDKRNLNLAIRSETTSVMNPVEYEQTKMLAADMMKSEAISKKFVNVNQVMMAVMAGREMGMGVMESLSDLYFVGGTLNIYGKGTPGALRRKGWRITYSNESQESCTATVTNPSTGEEITDTFTFEEAKLSGFVGDGRKPGWLPGANRRRKLRYGVLSLIIHTYIPEVLGPVSGIAEYSEDYIAGSQSAMDGEIIHPDAKREIARRRIEAAAAKRQELDNAEHTPEAVATDEVVDVSDDDLDKVSKGELLDDQA